MWYILGTGNHTLPDDYKCYNIQIAEKIEDFEHNIEVIYEGIFNTAFDRKKIQKILWWLSVDHFYTCSRTYISPFDYMEYNYKAAIKMLIERVLKSMCSFKNLFRSTISVKDLAAMDAVNAYQSEYAQWWLEKHNFPNILPLKDYINVKHCESYDKSIKQDIVLYNPKKGMGFTQRLIAAGANSLDSSPFFFASSHNKYIQRALCSSCSLTATINGNLIFASFLILLIVSSPITYAIGKY